MTTDEPDHGLTQEQQKLVEQMLHAAIDLTGAARDKRLADMCAGDTTVLNEARSLLERVDDVESHGFLESSVWLPDLEDAQRDLSEDELKHSKPGRRSAGSATSGIPIPSGGAKKSPSWGDCRRGDVIDSYIIRAAIGEGGFAHVYLAEQTQPVRRRVALKILKLGMDTKQLIARFEAERQALALMDHPHVAHVFDAGATKTGRPYFAMEHVAGTAITDYCDRHRLNIQQRLELFIQACEAAQHAHQKGIIHRDIKPSNVMVTLKDGAPSVKVIDFGVAKAINKEMSEQTIYTEQGQIIGTPEYMSPEQAEMSDLDIDTRADIYSLGVLLYELLVGELPFDRKQLRGGSFTEIQHIIRKIEPPKPSNRLTMLGHRCGEIAKSRGIDDRALRRRLRGDLDWITMKAMEKDRIRRYASASEFAADIKRHMKHEPVLAGPPSAAYKITKFVKRNRGRVAAAAAIAIVVTAGLIASLVLLAQRNAALASQAMTNRELAQANKLVAISHDTSHTATLIIDKGGAVKYANDIVARLADYTNAELMAQNVFELDSWTETEMEQLARRAIATGEVQKRSVQGTSTAGAPFSADVQFVPFEIGSGRHVLVTMQANAARQQFDHLLATTSDAVVLYDPKTKVIDTCNASAAHLLGYQDEAALNSLKIDAICADSAAISDELAAKAIANRHLEPVTIKLPSRFEVLGGNPLAATVHASEIIHPGEIKVMLVIQADDSVDP